MYVCMYTYTYLLNLYHIIIFVLCYIIFFYIVILFYMSKTSTDRKINNQQK